MRPFPYQTWEALLRAFCVEEPSQIAEAVIHLHPSFTLWSGRRQKPLALIGPFSSFANREDCERLETGEDCPFSPRHRHKYLQMTDDEIDSIHWHQAYSEAQLNIIREELAA
jgi:hypothetical protein